VPRLLPAHLRRLHHDDVAVQFDPVTEQPVNRVELLLRATSMLKLAALQRRVAGG